MKKGLPLSCYVFGLGISGISTAKWLQKKNQLLGAWDDNIEKRKIAAEKGILLIDPKDAFSKKTPNPTTLILSPGIPHTYPKPHSIVSLARENNCEIISDIELFYRTFPTAQIIGITGTNGKSTTTALMKETLDSCGVKSFIGGNFGIPCFDLPEKKDFLEKNSWIIFELSSFQIELSPSLKPKIFILLNITPDHLDRYASFSQYADVKWQLFKNLSPDSFSLVGPKLDARPSFSLPSSTYNFTEKDLPFSLKDCAALEGIHNKENATAVYLTCKHLKVPKDKIHQAFKTFTGLPHRQEKILNTPNITVINDSKATTFSATLQAIAHYKNIHWLVGGITKNDNILDCAHAFKNINHIYFFGKDAGYLKKSLESLCPSSLFETLEEATLSALNAIKKEKGHATLLLSPGCASFDQFKNFEHRGDFFKNLIHSLHKNNEI